MKKISVFACVPQKQTLKQSFMGESSTAVLSQGAGVRAGEQKKEGRKASLRMQYWFGHHYG